MKPLNRPRSISFLSAFVMVASMAALTPVFGAGPPAGLDVNVVNTPANPVPVTGSVTVVNTSTNPVPVTGSTTVSGAVAATQSGTWNVGLTGQPILVRNLDEPGNAPYQANAVFQLPSSCGAICTVSIDFPPVPPGKRLVLKAASGEIDLAPGGQIGRLEIINHKPGLSDDPFYMRPTLMLTTGQESLFAFNEQVLIFIDAGSRPSAYVFANAGSSGNSTITVTGYLVDLP